MQFSDPLHVPCASCAIMLKLTMGASYNDQLNLKKVNILINSLFNKENCDVYNIKFLFSKPWKTEREKIILQVLFGFIGK